MNLLSLFGDIDENFYQLGVLDRSGAKLVHDDVKTMLSTPWKGVNKGIEELAKLIIKNTLLKKPDFYHHLKAYSEGLNIKVEETAYIMLIPELISCMSKWAPAFSKGSLGCSSFFMRNHNEEVVHGRILDFPLQGSYDKLERAILYELNGMPKTLGFGSCGIPYPSISLMTEDGMTLALHQKFTNIFNKDGVSIFELIFDLLKKANDKKSVIDYLNQNESITTWSLYMSFKNGDILACDLMGKENYINEHHVDSKSVHYFCNRLENPKLNQADFIPYGFGQYNNMRTEIALKKIHKFDTNKEKSDEELIKLMATPFDQKKSKENLLGFNLDNITLSSLSVMTLNPTSQTALYLDGDAPKIYQDNILKIEKTFRAPEIIKIKAKKNQKLVPSDYQIGLSALMKAQKGFDMKDAQIIYHELQIAIDHLSDFPEKKIAEFYFLLAQYIYETHSKVQTHILHEFKNFEGKLPIYLNDHCLLFINRLERILKISPTTEDDKIIHPKLKDIRNFERKIPDNLLHLTTKSMIFPRLDILDIIYLYGN